MLLLNLFKRTKQFFRVLPSIRAWIRATVFEKVSLHALLFTAFLRAPYLSKADSRLVLALMWLCTVGLSLHWLQCQYRILMDWADIGCRMEHSGYFLPSWPRMSKFHIIETQLQTHT